MLFFFPCPKKAQMDGEINGTEETFTTNTSVSWNKV